MNNKKQKFLSLIALIPALPIFLLGLYHVFVLGAEGGMAGGFAGAFGILYIIASIIPACLLFVFTNGIFRHSPPVKRIDYLIVSIICHIITFILVYMWMNQAPEAIALTLLGFVLLVVISFFTLTAYKKATPQSTPETSAKQLPNKQKSETPVFAILLSFLPSFPSMLLLFLFHKYITPACLISSILLFVCLRDAYRIPAKKHPLLLTISTILHLTIFTCYVSELLRYNYFSDGWTLGAASTLVGISLFFAALWLTIGKYRQIYQQ